MIASILVLNLMDIRFHGDGYAEVSAPRSSNKETTIRFNLTTASDSGLLLYLPSTVRVIYPHDGRLLLWSSRLTSRTSFPWEFSTVN